MLQWKRNKQVDRPVTLTTAWYMLFLTCGERMLKVLLAEMSPVSLLMSSHLSGSLLISYLANRAEGQAIVA